MEELILIAAFGVMALIAMSQCAHHSSRRHEKLYLPPKQHTGAPVAHTLGPASGTDRTQEPVVAIVADRDRAASIDGRRS